MIHTIFLNNLNRKKAWLFEFIHKNLINSRKIKVKDRKCTIPVIFLADQPGWEEAENNTTVK